MRESRGGKPRGAAKAKAGTLFLPRWDLSSFAAGAHHWPVLVPPHGVDEAEQERTRWDPKDGELCLSRTKPEETLVEVRSDSDVQIDRQTWI